VAFISRIIIAVGGIVYSKLLPDISFQKNSLHLPLSTLIFTFRLLAKDNEQEKM